jgi:cyclophilin family peptidyl-prolyl cis-trans isomerase
MLRAVLPLLAATLVLGGCGGGGDGDGEGGGDGGQPTASSCRSVAAPEPKADGGATRPLGSLDADKTYVLVVETSCGQFEITLDQKSAPQATASLVSLSRAGFYDNTIFHRVVPDFVIQGGDPTGTGSGGPGYSTVDPPAADAAYTRGVVAMAKTAAEPPGTAGSQFFVVTAADAGLPPDYAIVGKVTKGFETVARIGALGDPATEQPSQTVLAERITVRQS